MSVRVTVTLTCFDPANPDHPYAQEWVHKDGYSSDEDGVRLRWDDTVMETYVPWSSVLRVDWGPCACLECLGTRATRKAAT